ncbi:hypothetical protein AGMMS49965_11230 [Bacteroidia bacterium]|nr:hypothetical protein AGMMS49965_11230 [Bacteroidia bacterium]
MHTTEELRQAREKYESYDPSCWTKAYFDAISGGFNVYHKSHQFTLVGGGGDAEQIVGLLLAQSNGKQVEFLPEQGQGKGMPDLRFEGQTWDVKFIEKASEDTIRKHIKDARKADNALFYWGNADKLMELHSAVNRDICKYQKINELHKIPNIYYMNNGLLKLLWHK